VTNHKFAPIFEEWAKTPSGSPCLGGRLQGVAGRWKKPITIIDDGSTTNDNRLGAVCDLLLVLEKTPSGSPYLGETPSGSPYLGETPSGSPCLGGEKESSLNREDIGGSDLLVVAADNLLFFSFQEFVDFAREKGTSCIMCHEQPSIEKLQRTGVVELDENHRVLGMEEKPQVPKSHWAVPPFYIYLKKDLDLVRYSVENGCGKDAPGNLAHYMVEHTTMHAWPMSAGRFDIGSLDTYYEAVEKYGI
jgi:glucose-1-phosphate thymidylyltransferase